MSTDASTGAGEAAPAAGEEYSQMLETLDVAIDEARRKIDTGRVRDEDKERVRQGWVRALAYAMNVRRQVQADRDLEELAERVEELEDDRL